MTLTSFESIIPSTDALEVWMHPWRCFGGTSEVRPAGAMSTVDASQRLDAMFADADNARHVESLRPHARLHSLWRLGSARLPRSRSVDIGHLQNGVVEWCSLANRTETRSIHPNGCEVVLTWRYLVQSHCEDEDQALYSLKIQMSQGWSLMYPYTIKSE